MSITTEDELRGMKAAGAIVRRVLDATAAAVRPGITTAELDRIAGQVIRQSGARSAPRHVYGFPGEICISVNEEAVHGIPGSRVLGDGDVVKLDVTIEKDGYMADAAITTIAGTPGRVAQRLSACANRALRKAMQVARSGRKIREIGQTVEAEVRRSGFSVIRDLCGHGIGKTIHEAPVVPNYDDPLNNEVLSRNLVITIEPIIAAGSGYATLGRDRWTVRTADRSLAAHFEHTLMITDGYPLILTAA